MLCSFGISGISNKLGSKLGPKGPHTTDNERFVTYVCDTEHQVILTQVKAPQQSRSIRRTLQKWNIVVSPTRRFHTPRSVFLIQRIKLPPNWWLCNWLTSIEGELSILCVVCVWCIVCPESHPDGGGNNNFEADWVFDYNSFPSIAMRPSMHQSITDGGWDEQWTSAVMILLGGVLSCVMLNYRYSIWDKKYFTSNCKQRLNWKAGGRNLIHTSRSGNGWLQMVYVCT